MTPPLAVTPGLVTAANARDSASSVMGPGDVYEPLEMATESAISAASDVRSERAEKNRVDQNMARNIRFCRGMPNLC